MLTLQQIFDKAVIGAFQQAKVARDPATRMCRYRSSDGSRCFVGLLLEPANYSENIEGGAPVGEMEESGRLRAALKASGIDADAEEVQNLLCSLQETHDDGCSEPSLRHLLRQWYNDLVAIAEHHNLSQTTLCEAYSGAMERHGILPTEN